MSKAAILIIEDERDLVDTLTMKLKKEGFAVEAKRDGQEGLDAVRSLKPDLVLLDLMLPTITGEKILQEIMQDEELKKIPVVIISNSGQPVEIKKLLQMGADDYIIKADFTIDDIMERVYNTLEKKQGKPDILVAEDEAFLRDVLAKKLRMEGFRVITTTDGESSLKTILDTAPRLVLLDLLMPGISGTEILAALKKDKRFDKNKTHIVILSNYTDKNENSLIKEMTQAYFVKSNFDIDEIADKIKSYL